MLLSLLVATALAAPTSLRGSASGQLFQDPLDLVDQPARLAEATRTDLYTFLAVRSDITTVTSSVVVPLTSGSLAASVGWNRSATQQADVDLLDETIVAERSRTDFVNADLAWGGPLSGRIDLGTGMWMSGAFGSSTADWSEDGDDSIARFSATLDDRQAPFRRRTQDWQAGGRLGLVVHAERATTDLHVQVAMERTSTTSHGGAPGWIVTGFIEDPVYASTSNRAVAVPALVIDTLVPTGARTAFRGWFRLQATAGGVAVDEARFVSPGSPETDPVDRTTTFVADYTHDLGGALASRLLLHARFGPLALRTGVRLAGGYRNVRSVWIETETHTGLDRGFGVIVREANLSVGVPLALEATVHPRVVLRAWGEGTWRWSQTDRAEGAADPDDLEATATGRAVRDAQQTLTGAGALGVSWLALDVLSVEASLFGGGRTGVAGTLGSLGLSTSLVFHL